MVYLLTQTPMIVLRNFVFLWVFALSLKETPEYLHLMDAF